MNLLYVFFGLIVVQVLETAMIATYAGTKPVQWIFLGIRAVVVFAIIPPAITFIYHALWPQLPSVSAFATGGAALIYSVLTVAACWHQPTGKADCVNGPRQRIS